MCPPAWGCKEQGLVLVCPAVTLGHGAGLSPFPTRGLGSGGVFREGVLASRQHLTEIQPANPWRAAAGHFNTWAWEAHFPWAAGLPVTCPVVPSGSCSWTRMLLHVPLGK